MKKITGLMRFERYKLWKDGQMRFVFFLILGYILYSFTFMEAPVDHTFTGWCISKTTDIVFMLFFIGLASAAVFTIDYKNRTYKNFLPYVKLKHVFISKILVNLGAVFFLLLFWYALVLALSAYKTGTFDANALQPLLYRFVTQYFLILFHSAFIIAAGVITKSRAVASVFTVAAWLGYSFLPVGGKRFFDVVVEGCQWETPPGIFLCLAFAAVFFIGCTASLLIAERQEVIL